jgi:membrane fusion protein (multidrug efflux system)
MKREGYDSFSNEAEEDDKIELILSDGSVFEHKGYVKFLNREIDPTTGTILLQAIFPNPDKVLRPGQFAKVRGRMANVEDAVVIPQRCVMDQQGNKFVYVVDDENKVNIRFITISYTIPGSYVVSDGLQKGDVILVEGLIKVRPGATIDPIDYREAMKMQKANQGQAQPADAKKEENAESKQ